VGAGARNIAWLSTGSSKWFPEPPGGVTFTNPQRDAWSNTYYQQTQQLLVPLANSGVRIFLFNFGILQERVFANPGLYGFTSATNCEAGPGTNATPNTVRINFADCFYDNSVHPTGPAMALIAAYMANQIDAPTTVVPQGSIATSLAKGFSTSFTGANLFSDALIAYGRHGYTLDRQGVIDIVHGSTSADTFTAAARAGYLFDAGPVRVGPIAGLNYTLADIQGYTETGDSLLTMMVNEQNVDSLTGNAGLQMRFPFELGGNLHSPFINVTAEHDLLGSGRVVTTTQVTAPLLPVLTPVPSESGTYGKIAAGVAARIGGNVSATFNAETTFAREGGNGLVVSGGIKMGL